MRTVTNQYGIEIDFDVAVPLMDDEIREKLNELIAPCTDQEFFDSYCAEHEIKYGCEWVLDTENPVY